MKTQSTEALRTSPPSTPSSASGASSSRRPPAYDRINDYQQQPPTPNGNNNGNGIELKDLGRGQGQGRRQQPQQQQQQQPPRDRRGGGNNNSRDNDDCLSNSCGICALSTVFIIVGGIIAMCVFLLGRGLIREVINGKRDLIDPTLMEDHPFGGAGLDRRAVVVGGGEGFGDRETYSEADIDRILEDLPTFRTGPDRRAVVGGEGDPSVSAEPTSTTPGQTTFPNYAGSATMAPGWVTITRSAAATSLTEPTPLPTDTPSVVVLSDFHFRVWMLQIMRGVIRRLAIAPGLADEGRDVLPLMDDMVSRMAAAAAAVRSISSPHSTDDDFPVPLLLTVPPSPPHYTETEPLPTITATSVRPCSPPHHTDSVLPRSPPHHTETETRPTFTPPVVLPLPVIFPLPPVHGGDDAKDNKKREVINAANVSPPSIPLFTGDNRGALLEVAGLAVASEILAPLPGTVGYPPKVPNINRATCMVLFEYILGRVEEEHVEKERAEKEGDEKAHVDEKERVEKEHQWWRELEEKGRNGVLEKIVPVKSLMIERRD